MSDEELLEVARTAKLVSQGWLAPSPLMTKDFASALAQLAEKHGMDLALPADRIHATKSEGV